MMIFLFTDFGAADLYVGQVKAVLARDAPGVPVIDLLHEAPAFNVRASAHLLAALSSRIPSGSVVLAVVDPGVGGVRDAVALSANGNWLVGPDNGLLSVLAARAEACDYHRIVWKPPDLSSSFHGRDLFAPVAAAIACAQLPAGRTVSMARLGVDFGSTDLGEIIYIDHYGNAYTGLRGDLAPDTRMMVSGHAINHARVFSDVAPGALFWYENSLGLLEIAGNRCSAAQELKLAVGHPVGIIC